MATSKKVRGPQTNDQISKDLRIRENLAFFLNILFWIVFVATIYLGSLANEKTTVSEEPITGSWEEITLEMTD